MQQRAHWSEWLLGSTALLFAVVLAGAQYAPPARAAGQSVVAADTALGRRIFTGKGNCFTCHGAYARGTPLAPDLTDAEQLHVDDTVASIQRLVTDGVAQPTKHPAPMPPMGGAVLTVEEIAAVAAWVRSQRPH